MFGFWENKFFRNLFLTFFWLMAVLILVLAVSFPFSWKKEDRRPYSRSFCVRWNG